MCNGCDASLKAGSTRLAVGLPKCISLAVTYVVGVNMSGMSICGCLWIAFGVLWLVWALRSKPTQMRESLGSRFSHVVAGGIREGPITVGERPERYGRLGSAAGSGVLAAGLELIGYGCEP